jgi:DNA-binding transcriptional LysR family regulator
MELARIEAFLVLCDELHFGQTAGRLHVSQPRVSRLIAALETEIGGTLFDRTSRRVTLTPLGTRLRDDLIPAHAGLTAALATASSLARSPAGTLRVGFAATTAVPALDELVAAFERQHPDCSLSLQEVDHWGVPAAADATGPLQAGEIDVMVCWLVIDDPGLTLGPAIADYPRALAVGVDHPLAAERSVSVEVLADHPIPSWDYRGLSEKLREDMVPTRTPSGRPVRSHPTPVRTVGEVGSLIARGQVVLPAPASMHNRFGNDRIVMVPIHDMAPVPLGLIWCTAHENARIRALAQTARNFGCGDRGELTGRRLGRLTRPG